MRKLFVSLCLTVVMVLLVTGLDISAQQAKPKAVTAQYDEALYQAMQWRCIGPYRGGRATAVAGIPDQPYTYYFGATGGGVWKSTDGGMNWNNVSDGFFKTGSVGAVAVSEWDPNVVYVGMGEAPIRGNVSHGDGVYKSVDAGKTWTHMGLTDTRQISRIRIHPRDPDLVYVAALGHVFGISDERGVFRSRDGGVTWEKVLFRSDKAGAIDLVMDPHNPRVLYAAIWEAWRTPYGLNSGGPDSGLFKSTDGGDTWTEITRNPGLPEDVIGKIGVTASPARADRVWAIVESRTGGVFRSDNGGATWSKPQIIAHRDHMALIIDQRVANDQSLQVFELSQLGIALVGDECPAEMQTFERSHVLQILHTLVVHLRIVQLERHQLLAAEELESPVRELWPHNVQLLQIGQRLQFLDAGVGDARLL